MSVTPATPPPLGWGLRMRKPTKALHPNSMLSSHLSREVTLAATWIIGDQREFRLREEGGRDERSIRSFLDVVDMPEGM